MQTRQNYDAQFELFVEEIGRMDIGHEDTATALKNLELFSKSRPPEAPPEEPAPVPETRKGRILLALGKAWDNETTRVFIKAGGAFAGVAAVAYSTIHKDHVLERQAIAQANQRN